jgi:subtilase family serine protease
MRKMLLLMFLLVGGSAAVYAQGGRVVAPPSTSLNTPGLPHTHLFVYIPEEGANPAIPSGETPASIACVYGLVSLTSGCPKSGTVLPTGGAKAIAVVEYGVYNSVQSDMNVFNAQWHLPAVTVHTVCYPAPPCPNNAGTGWDLETALDIEYAHAMAPHAAIYIAAFKSDPLGDGAETGIASHIAATYGAGEVSNSWTYNGGENWCGSGNCELGYDHEFTQHGIVYFGSAGDNGAQVNYPSVSPNVVSAGGTHINRDSHGNFVGTESCWRGSGGGISRYEARPSYQSSIMSIVHSFRGIPDMSADADPASGVAVYSSTYCGGWCVVGGTSVSSPVLAGYVNSAASFLSNTDAELTKAYDWYAMGSTTYHRYFRDITTGSNGHAAVPGWDECTGLGSPIKPSGF